MRKTLKLGICFLLCLSLAFSLSACGGSGAITESNITKTVSLVEKALREFDKDTLQKYVNSKTLNYIFQLAGSREQIEAIGKLMFENLELTVKAVDTKENTVTLAVKNKDLKDAGEWYSRMLYGRTRGDTSKMLKLLSDEQFLNISVKTLTAQISTATIPDNPTEITVQVKADGKTPVLVFDDAAEDAVSGGAITAITETMTALKKK